MDSVQKFCLATGNKRPLLKDIVGTLRVFEEYKDPCTLENDLKGVSEPYLL